MENQEQPLNRVLPVTQAAPRAVNVGVWSTLEHERYLRAKYANPKASWKQIALLVGTRSARQVILHDQKFRMKMERRRTKSEQPVAPSATVQHDQSGEAIPEMRYIDSMGVLLLASVASTRVSKIEAMATSEGPSTVETSNGIEQNENVDKQDQMAK